MASFKHYKGNPVRYWLQDSADNRQNFGDYITELLLDRLFIMPTYPADAYHLIGSVISEFQITADLQAIDSTERRGLIAFWCCGMRDETPLPEWALKHVRFFGVRGPNSRQVLQLPPETVLGDPGLLVPLLHPAEQAPDRKETVCIIHVHDPKSEAQILQETGADRVIRAKIDGTEACLLELISIIQNAKFVLCGALHGAIVACAYQTPFSYYDSGYLNVPFKWADFASSVNLPCVFAKTVAEGEELYREVLADAYRRLPITPMLAVAPFAVRIEYYLKAMHLDGLISKDVLDALLSNIKPAESYLVPTPVEAQTAWLERVTQNR